MESEFASFLAANSEKIINYGKLAYKKIDAKIQTTIKTAYRNYLSNVTEKYSKSKSFFIRNQPVNLYKYYVPTELSCGNNNFEDPLFIPLVTFSKRIIITGSGGSGKSIMMRHLFLNCIKSEKHIPIIIELRDLNSSELNLNELINEVLEINSFNISRDYIENSFSDGHFCLFFDGLDEVVNEKQADVVKSIIHISSKYKKCPIFLSSRNDEIFRKFEDFSILQVNPLTMVNAIDLVRKLPFDEIVKNKFIDDLGKFLFEKHHSFLSNPLLLSIMLITYNEHAEIPSKLSVFYNQAYEVLFQRHDANKGAYVRKRKTKLDMNDFASVFSLFSLQTYDKKLISISRSTCLSYIQSSIDKLSYKETAENYLEDLIKSACLLIEDGLDIAYSHRSFQEYFTALYISKAPPATQEILIDRYFDNISKDNIIFLLSEINQNLIEKYLIIPKLSDFFDSIGVKNNLTERQAIKIIKSNFTEIRITKDGTYGFHSDNGVYIYSLFRIIHSLYGKYKFPTPDFFNENKKYMQSKYKHLNNKNGDLIFTTKNLNLNSEFLVDIVNGGGTFSKDYFISIFNTLAEIKNKHLNEKRNLFDLLGIED